MRTGVDRFLYFKHTKRRGSYCVYKDVEYDKSTFLGAGTYSNAFKFTSQTPSLCSVVIKIEKASYYDCRNNITRLRTQQDFADAVFGYNTFYDGGEYFLNDAYFAKLLFGEGAFCGDLYDELNPHYTLLPFLDGQLLCAIQNVSLKSFILICEALFSLLIRYCSRKIVHGDVKEDNIMIYGDESVGYRAVLFDFTFTRFFGEKSVGLHNPEYHAPELINTISVEPSQDLFSMGSSIDRFYQHQKIHEPVKNDLDKIIADCKRSKPIERIFLGDAIQRVLLLRSYLPKEISETKQRVLKKYPPIQEETSQTASTESKSEPLTTITLPHSILKPAIKNDSKRRDTSFSLVDHGLFKFGVNINNVVNKPKTVNEVSSSATVSNSSVTQEKQRLNVVFPRITIKITAASGSKLTLNSNAKPESRPNVVNLPPLNGRLNNFI